MPSCNPPSKPSDSANANQPANCAKPPCAAKEAENPCLKGKKCWENDYEKDIKTAACGRYYKSFKHSGQPYIWTDQIQFKIYTPVKTSSEITVEVRFKLEFTRWVTKRLKVEKRAKNKLIKGIDKFWNGKFVLKASDPECAACGEKSFKVKYKASWVNSGEDYTIKIHNVFPRECVDGNVMKVSLSTTPWTYAHEFAHCIGIPDEYSYTNRRESVRYLKPNGSLVVSIVALPDGVPKNGPGATIMSTADNKKTLPRHCWNIGIEVQDLLTSKLGRKIECTIL
jgi:type VI secretion system secreted protein VgrG